MSSSIKQLLVWALALAAVALFQLALLTHGDMRLIAPERLDGAFDSMLQHLLRGDVTVDPDAIGYESFTREGRTYSYFGILPALLRLPALLLGPADPNRMHLARVSCLVASVAYVAILLRTLLLAHRSLPAERRSTWLFVLVAVGLMFGGTQTILLSSAYLYSEPVMWGAVLAAGFNLVVVRAALRGSTLSAGDLVVLALLAGVALNTRASIGFDLTVGAGLILGWCLLCGLLRRPAAPEWGSILPACAALAVGLGVAALINWARWGNPLTFADMPLQDIIRRHPERWAELQANGIFNLRRMPTSATYYLTGLTYALKNFGQIGEFITKLYEPIEGPPSSPLLTGPVWTILALLGIRSTLRQRWFIPATLAGHIASALLLLCAMSLTLRYRQDFAPLLALPAFFGFVVLSGILSSSEHRRRLLLGLTGLGALGIASSLYVLLMSDVLNPAVPVAVRCTLHAAAPFLPINNPDSPPPPGWAASTAQNP